jgi:uncharacterized protein YuzE
VQAYRQGQDSPHKKIQQGKVDMKAQDVIDKIKEKCELEEEIECAIVKKDGNVVAIDIKDHAKDLKQILKMFA